MRPIRDAVKALLPRPIIQKLRLLRNENEQRLEFIAWRQRNYAPPSPNKVKRQTLLRYNLPGSTWIETGTYQGDTTAILARLSPMVFSIEPEPTLYARAVERFSRCPNVKILNSTSEAAFPSLLPGLSGSVCFWLDGHYSAGGTYLGAKVSPIEEELACIAANLNRFGEVKILVDDVRLFGSDGYPSLDFLVDWTRKHGFGWSIEHDIFVMRQSQ